MHCIHTCINMFLASIILCIQENKQLCLPVPKVIKMTERDGRTREKNMTRKRGTGMSAQHGDQYKLIQLMFMLTYQ